LFSFAYSFDEDDNGEDEDDNDDKVWCSLVVSSVPSLLAFLAAEQESLVTKVGLSGGLLFVVHAMYQCLVNYTGAVPAEFYSIKKRPAYADYQRRVNMFFPGPRRE